VTPKLLSIKGLLFCGFDRRSLRILQCSDSLAHAAGFESHQAAEGRFLLDLISSASIEGLQSALQKEAPATLHCQLAGQGTPSVNATLLIDSSSEIEMGVLVCVPCEDLQGQLADLQNTIEQLQSKTNRMASFTALVIHDLRNALHLVTANTDLLSMNPKAESIPSVAERIRKIQQSGMSMATLLDGVSQYLLFEVGEYPMEMTDLNELVDQLILNTQDHPTKTIHIHRSASLPSLICEKSMVHELFQNLIGNAIKYTKESPVKIEIGVAGKESDPPQFFIRDNGVGISEEDMGRIFSPFARADHHALNRHGTGMGMTLVKRIVERHGGDVWLESTVDLGTTVHFQIGSLGLS
jgi:signal transduction histidine kinase